MDKEQLEEVRTAYIEKIDRQLDLCPIALLPSAVQESSFQETLQHIVRLVSSQNSFVIKGDPFDRNVRDDVTKRNRKQCMERILYQLRWIEHKRLYDPPADDEIGYYLLMKKYMRSILAYFLSIAFTPANTVKRRFGCYSAFVTLHNSEELVELNQLLANFSEVLSNMDIENVYALFNPLVCVKDNYEVAQIVCGSKARGFKFYKHKFKLALIDLRNTEFAFCPPSKEEKRAYTQALDNIAASLIGNEDDTNVYSSNQLMLLYIERIIQEISDIKRHCEKVKLWILKKLSFTECWEHAVEQYHLCKHFEEAEEEERAGVHAELVKFRKSMADKCKVPIQDLPIYICHVEQCLTIALFMQLLVIDRYYDCIKTADLGYSKLTREAFSALNLLRRADQVHCEAMRKGEKNVFHGQCQDENAQILEGILEDLRYIGGSNDELDEEEMLLVHKIWASIASSTHFFISAMAYELEKEVIKQDVLEIQGRRSDTKPINGVQSLDCILFELYDQMYDFTRILYHYKTGLIEKNLSSFMHVGRLLEHFNTDIDDQPGRPNPRVISHMHACSAEKLWGDVVGESRPVPTIWEARSDGAAGILLCQVNYV